MPMRSDPQIGVDVTTGDRLVGAGAKNASGKYQLIAVDDDGHTQVDILSGAGGTQYADGAVRGTSTGTLAMGDDGTNIQSIHTDSSGDLQIDVLTMPIVAVTGTFYQATQPVSLASVPSHAVTNAGTFAVQIDGDALTSLQLIDNAISGAGFNITQFGGAAVPIGAGLETTAIRVTLPTDGTGKVTVVSGTAANLKAEVTIAAAQTLATVTTVGTVSTITNTVPTKEIRAATAAQTTVADNAASTTILAANANRLGATVSNDSSAVLYLLLGSTAASATSYSVRMVQYGYYEIPFGYTGQLTGIWASDPNDGAARI